MPAITIISRTSMLLFPRCLHNFPLQSLLPGFPCLQAFLLCCIPCTRLSSHSPQVVQGGGGSSLISLQIDPFPSLELSSPIVQQRELLISLRYCFKNHSSPPDAELASELEPTPSNRGLCVTSSPTDWNPPLKKGAAQVVHAVSRLGSWLGAFVKKHGLFIRAIVCQLAQR